MPPADRWFTVELESRGAIEIRLKRPTFEDLMHDAEMNHGYVAMRVKALVLDWRGVNSDQDPPQPVPYSWDMFKAVSQLHPKLFRDVAVEASKAFLGLDEGNEKNSDTPPVASSTVAANVPETNNTNG
jgi:hypothetical protein